MTRPLHKPDPDLRLVISDFRLHDRVDAIVARLLEQKLLFRLDGDAGVLVRRKSASTRTVVVVTTAWMENLLQQQFDFENPAHPPAAKFILARWRSFPSVLKTGKETE